VALSHEAIWIFNGIIYSEHRDGSTRQHSNHVEITPGGDTLSISVHCYPTHAGRLGSDVWAYIRYKTNLGTSSSVTETIYRWTGIRRALQSSRSYYTPAPSSQ
jgi:hypothetical protein